MALRTKSVGLITSRKKRHVGYLARVREMKRCYKTLFGQSFKGTRDEVEALRHRHLVEERILFKWILNKLFIDMGTGFH
jgi:hypothetical protein